MPKKLTTAQFITRAKTKHGEGRYDYSLVNYVNSVTPVKIICNVCGCEFEQRPDSHLQGKGCHKCAVIKTHPLTTFEEFLKNARSVHGEKYDYSQVKWNKVTDKITIICPEHGPFEQAAINHYWAKQGCPKCGLKKLGANKRHSLEEFLRLAREKHGNKYDYSLITEYKNGTTPVKIICNTCGKTFEQKPKVHIQGHGCTYCANNTTISTEEFIRRAKDVWGDQYTYEKVKYTSNKKKVIITCREHGDFPTTAYDFLQGHGCPQCGIEKNRLNILKTQEEFIAACKETHGNKYDYSKAIYKGRHRYVTVICPIHGEFRQHAGNHMTGRGCPKCKFEEAAVRNAKSKEKFIEDARKVHGNFYNYDKVVYTNNKTNVIVSCPIHGDFDVAPQDHLYGMNGCPKCQCSKGETAIRVWLEAHEIKHDWHKPIKSKLAIGKRKKFIPDFYIESANLIIEYNGEQHYRAKKEWGGEKQLLWQQRRDAALRLYCEQEGIRLIEIPYTEFTNIDHIMEKIFGKDDR
jgi:hypothetical protein